MARYYGVPLRNSVALGLGGIIALTTAKSPPLPSLPFQVTNSTNDIYDCGTTVIDSADMTYVVVDSVKDSAGTEYFPV